eukprot:437351-Pyramimonas_sp.AAC.1
MMVSSGRKNVMLPNAIDLSKFIGVRKHEIDLSALSILISPRMASITASKREKKTHRERQNAALHTPRRGPGR